MKIIDGSYGLGSGQLTRYALIMSCITKTPIKIINIRQGREKPGLKAQHLAAVNILQQACHARVSPIHIGSKELTWEPKEIEGITTTVDIGTAGSITLLIQNILIPLLYAKKKSDITIIGGTDVPWSPQYDYLREVIVQFFKPYAKTLKITCEKRGYYPQGGGKVRLIIEPLQNHAQKPIELIKQQKITSIYGRIHASDDLEKKRVADRIQKSTEYILNEYNHEIQREYVKTFSPGCGITLWTKENCIGGDILGAKQILAEDLGKQCAENILKEIASGAVVDRHMADNIIPLLFLIGGKIKTSEITEHTKTAVWIGEQFVKKKVDIKENIISIH